ncbi:MAG: hypothetical protein K2Y05_07980 [Hyphomicrobiaceae bacterium]|nr:hypothetical protein [Hyphomicrobiaceae bacterium]
MDRSQITVEAETITTKLYAQQVKQERAMAQGDGQVANFEGQQNFGVAAGSDGHFDEFYRELNNVDDPREGVAMVREKIARLAAAGVEVPEELVRTERQFQTECVIQSQGR